ncbi:hypothetical protein D3C75_920620 [compost metagenome]
MFGRFAEALGPQQFDQQGSACRVEGTQSVKVNGGALVVLTFEGFTQALEVGVMGERPIPRDPQQRGGLRGIESGTAGYRIAHKLLACSADTQCYVIA